MADVEVASLPAATSENTTPKKVKKSPVAKKSAATVPKPKPTHPKTSDMVNAAIGGLNEKGGSSMRAIKKYMAEHYAVDADRLAHFIRKYLRSAVEAGKLLQVKGTGAAGSFRLPKIVEKPAPKPKKPKEVKPAKKKKEVAAKVKPAVKKDVKDATAKKEKVKKPAVKKVAVPKEKATKAAKTKPTAAAKTKVVKPKAVPKEKTTKASKTKPTAAIKTKTPKPKAVPKKKAAAAAATTKKAK